MHLSTPATMQSCAGNRLASLASLSYTQFASSVKGAALLAAGRRFGVHLPRERRQKGERCRELLIELHVVTGGDNLMSKCPSSSYYHS